MENNNHTFLAIDDNKLNLISLRALINESFPAAEVLTAQSGTEGLQIARERIPDIILLDIMIPDMDGFAVCRQLKDDPVLQDIPVIFVTALESDKKLRMRALDAGAEAFLTKPLDEVELFVQLRSMIKINESNRRKKDLLDHLENNLALKDHELSAIDREKKEESERYRAIIESTTDLIWLVDPVNFGLVAYNSAYINYFKSGYNIDIKPGMTPYDLLPETFALDWPNHYRKALNEGPYELEYKTSALDRAVVCSIYPLSIDGKIVGISVFGHDITERKLAEEAMQLANKNLKTILDSSLFGVVTIGKDKTIRWANEAACKLMGLDDPSEVIGKQCGEYFCNAQQDQCPIIDKNQSVDKSECILKRFDGTLIPIIKSVVQINIDQEELLLETFIDITDRKKFENDLRKSEEQYRQAQVLTHAGHYVLDLGKQEFTGSDEAFRIYGFSGRKNVKFEEIIQCISKRDIDRVLKAVEQLVTEGKLYTEEFEICPFGSNESRYVTNIANLGQDENGNPQAVGIVQDITEQKRSEIALRESMEQNQRILDNLQDAYFQADQDGNFQMLNPAAVKMYHCTAKEEIVGKPAHSLYADPKERDRMIKILKENGKVEDFITKGLRKDGSTFWVSMNAQFLRNEDGSIIGTEGVVRDITERVTLIEQLQQQRNNLALRLNQSVKAISKIGELRDAYTAGHQRKTAELACAIASEMGLAEELINNLSYGALIHDIGKIYIASDILNKPGRISDLEYQILQTHAEHGYNIVSEIDFPIEIPTMIYQHHERLDGSGYPQGLSGDDIILESRILAVADVIEAMSSHRPYRPALGIDIALEEIRQHKGRKYDPEVVNTCIRLFKVNRFAFSTDQAIY